MQTHLFCVTTLLGRLFWMTSLVRICRLRCSSPWGPFRSLGWGLLSMAWTLVSSGSTSSTNNLSSRTMISLMPNWHCALFCFNQFHSMLCSTFVVWTPTWWHHLRRPWRLSYFLWCAFYDRKMAPIDWAAVLLAPRQRCSIVFFYVLHY